MLPFRIEDVTLILGLHYNGDIVSFKHERVKSEFEQTFLNKMHNQHCDAIKDNFFKLVCRKDGEEEIFVKLLVVYFMMTIFFSNTSLNVLTFATRHIDDLGRLAVTLGRMSFIGG